MKDEWGEKGERGKGEDESSQFLFVYGTLRKHSGGDLYHVLARNAAFVGDGTVQGRLYSLGEYPGLVLARTPTDTVKGEVYRIAGLSLNEVLALLDEYEGCGQRDPEHHEYRRTIIPVRIDNQNTIRAWAYVLNRDTQGLRRIHSGDFIGSRAS